MTDTPKPKRHWYQYTLRTLMVLVFIAAVVFAWLGCRIREIQTEIRAAAEFEKLGADIRFQEAEGLPIPNRWLWKCFRDPPVLYLGLEPGIADAGLEHLKGLTNLRHLDLGRTRVTDADLEHLKRLVNLELLILSNTQITNAGLEHLKKLTHLKPSCAFLPTSLSTTEPASTD